jgi:GTPase SAR1 family protein
VDEAAYNSFARESATGCLPGTRVHVLKMIHDWVNDGSGKLLFWLNGAAGVGKSTIAHSIAKEYSSTTYPSASFFFSRDQQEHRELKFLFQTIAFQLGNSCAALKQEIVKAMDDQAILTSNLQNQLQKLILDPISQISDCFASPIIVVLDALDECEEEAAVSYIIKLLVQKLKGCTLPLKFFVTSRPERHLRSTFHSSDVGLGTYPFVLHDVDPSDVQHDIKAFVHTELKDIADSNKEVLRPDPWPMDQEVEALVFFSAGLFIAAATALKFVHPIRGSPDPRVRLRIILDSGESAQGAAGGSSSAFQYLDHMYSHILKHAMPTSGKQSLDIFQQFRTIVGTIVLAYGRLTVDELGALLQMKNKQIQLALAELHSVIHVPDGNDTIRAFHLSFHDFLINKE